MPEENVNVPEKRTLGFWDSVAIIVAIVVGVGIFKVPTEIAKYLNSPSLIFLAWFIGGLIALSGALCYAELSSSFPKTGGNYIYLKESYGPWAGFLFGWTELLVIRTGSIAALAFISAEYMLSFFCVTGFSIKVTAVLIIFVYSYLNIIGLRQSKAVLNVFTGVKILALIAMVVFGIMSKKGELSNFQSVISPAGTAGFPLFGLALIPILWTYGGWHENTFMAGETKDAAKTIPRALFTGTLIVTALYLAINALYIYLIPVNRIAGTDLVASDALRILFGRPGQKALEILVIIATLGSINATMMTGSRITYAMSKDSAIFKYLGGLDMKFGTPRRSIIINGIWSAVLVVTGSFNELLFFTGIMVWVFFALVGGGLFILRHKFPETERPYKVWAYPVLPLIFIIVCIALSVNTLIFYPFQSWVGLALAMTGIPVYMISQKWVKERTI